MSTHYTQKEKRKKGKKLAEKEEDKKLQGLISDGVS